MTNQKPHGQAGLIRIRGARQHNLKNINLDLPRGQVIAITGPSGSGKSSLAFDTLFAEGQRKFVESLSAKARQFLRRIPKPDADLIEGLPPAIAVEQRAASAGPRSTVATVTEIHDYLRLLYAAAGIPHDPATGEPLVRQTQTAIADHLMALPEGTRLTLLAETGQCHPRDVPAGLAALRKEGFVRARLNGCLIDLSENETPQAENGGGLIVVEAVVDRLVVRDGIEARLHGSLESALRWGKNVVKALIQTPEHKEEKELLFSTDYRNPRTGFTLPRLTPLHFSFNSHLGACPQCHGLGHVISMDVERLIDRNLSIKQGGIRLFEKLPASLRKAWGRRLEKFAAARSIPCDIPLGQLRDEQLEALLHGANTTAEEGFPGVLAWAEQLMREAESANLREQLKSLCARSVCAACQGHRLRPEILCVRLKTQTGHLLNIQEFCALPLSAACKTVEQIEIPRTLSRVTDEIIQGLKKRLSVLEEMGLGYLELNRPCSSLSGGEFQRVRLAAQIGGGLSGVLYVLDEPSIGLHASDNWRLIRCLHKLRNLGNTVLIVEHDAATIRAADFIVELGPGAGPQGGHLIACGTLREIQTQPASSVAALLSGRVTFAAPAEKKTPLPPRDSVRRSGKGWVWVGGASAHNLKNLDVFFPCGCLCVVAGVSGSGKSTLVFEVLLPALRKALRGQNPPPEVLRDFAGAEQFADVIVVDQSPIGRTPRSIPASYLGILAPIRHLFAQTPAARARGYLPARFSFNQTGGRCEHCKGEGVIKIPMQFLPDATAPCEVCEGKRFNRQTLEITYKGKSIADVLEMTASEAARFFTAIPQVASKLKALDDAGLGYIRLGQPAATLSGGEAQRLKLAAELARNTRGATLYLLDEPTTGLHFAEVQRLLEALWKLRDAGHTLIVIEHNLDVLKSADWIVELGPCGGEGGGYLVAEGPPEKLALCPSSPTAPWLAEALQPAAHHSASATPTPAA